MGSKSTKNKKYRLKTTKCKNRKVKYQSTKTGKQKYTDQGQDELREKTKKSGCQVFMNKS